jgi:hypothetical protein
MSLPGLLDARFIWLQACSAPSLFDSRLWFDLLAFILTAQGESYTAQSLRYEMSLPL